MAWNDRRCGLVVHAMKLGIKTIEALDGVKRGRKQYKGRKAGFYSGDVRIPDRTVAALQDAGLVTWGGRLTQTGALILQAFKLGKRYGG